MGLATPTPEQHNCDTCIISQLKDESISLPSLQFVGEFAPHALTHHLADGRMSMIAVPPPYPTLPAPPTLFTCPCPNLSD